MILCRWEIWYTFLASRLVLRIATDDSKAVCRLSVKFGATLKTSRLLLERAKELDIDVIGVRWDLGDGRDGDEVLDNASFLPPWIVISRNSKK